MKERDDYYDRHTALTDRMLAVIPADAETPEDLLIAAEEARAKAKAALRRMPDKDRRTLLLSRGAGLSTRAIAAQEGVSHQAIQKRIKAARLKFSWYAGAGSLFTGIDIRRDFLWRIEPEQTQFLIAFWREKSIVATAAALRASTKRCRELYRVITGQVLPRLVEEDRPRFERYQRGFAALHEVALHGMFARGVGVEHTKKRGGAKKLCAIRRYFRTRFCRYFRAGWLIYRCALHGLIRAVAGEPTRYEQDGDDDCFSDCGRGWSEHDQLGHTDQQHRRRPDERHPDDGVQQYPGPVEYHAGQGSPAADQRAVAHAEGHHGRYGHPARPRGADLPRAGQRSDDHRNHRRRSRHAAAGLGLRSTAVEVREIAGSRPLAVK